MKNAGMKLVNDQTAKNVVRPNPNGSAISTEGSAELPQKFTVENRQILPKMSIIVNTWTEYEATNCSYVS